MLNNQKMDIELSNGDRQASLPNNGESQNIQKINKQQVSQKQQQENDKQGNKKPEQSQEKAANKKKPVKREKSQKQQDLLKAETPKPVVKKSKNQIDINYRNFLPEFLFQLNISSQKNKNTIRIGKNYQANVPTRCIFAYKYRPLSYLKVWTPTSFCNDTLKKFKQQFGQGRTEQQLCLLMHQYQCDSDQIMQYINKYRSEIKRLYSQRDRDKSKVTNN